MILEGRDTLMDNDLRLDDLGRYIRERRAELGLTQVQLAARVGWTQERVSLLENARYGMPSVPSLIRLAQGLEVPLNDLIVAAGHAEMAATLPSEGEAASVTLLYALQQLLAIDALTLTEVLDTSSDLLAEAMGADKVDAFVREPETDTLVAVGTSDTPIGRRQHELGLHREPIANGGRTVEVFQTGKAFYSPQADQDPNMVRGVVEGLGIRSYLAVPLWTEDRVFGVLTAACTQPNRFSEDERHFFEAVARWVAMIALRAELRESLTRRAVEDGRRLVAEEMITLLAHDFGNALMPISGRLELLRRRFVRENRSSDVEDVCEVSRAITRLQRMVTELLDVSRIDNGIFALSCARVDLVRLVQEAVSDARLRRQTVETRLPDSVWMQADALRISQILQNLLDNAVAHTDDDVPIRVDIKVESRSEEQWVILEVADDGPGIPADQVEGLFSRFTSGSHSSGLGIGLYLARQIAQAHGGTLLVETGPGRGTCFRLSLPVRAEEVDVLHTGARSEVETVRLPRASGPAGATYAVE